MNTSKYSTDDRKQIKRDLRSPHTESILKKGLLERKDLEAKLAERKNENEKLREIVRDQIEAGAWNSSWEALGFKKKEK